MSKKKTGKFKIFLTALFMFITVGSIVWASWITYAAPQKEIANTFILSEMQVKHADELTGEEVVEKQVFCEVEKYDNAIEIKFNYLLDESQQYFFHSGIQLISEKENIVNDIKDSEYNYTKDYKTIQIKNDEKIKTNILGDGEWALVKNYYLSEYNHIVGNKQYEDIKTYYYNSFDNFEYTSINTPNLMNEKDPMFKLQFQDNGETKVYGVKFKNYDEKKVMLGIIPTKVVDYDDLDVIATGKYKSEDYKDKDSIFYRTRHYRIDNYYRAKDLSYFVEQILQNISGQSEGFSGTTYLKLDDIFKYYECIDESKGVYEEIDRTDDEVAKISHHFTNYYLTRIKIHDGKLKNSNQSMFQSYGGSRNYGNSEDIAQQDYYIGRSIVDVNSFDFDWITVDGVNYRFALSEVFIEKYKKVSKKELNIVIDLDFLNKNNIKFTGFVSGTFNDFKVHKCVTTQTINGEIVERWVSYV